LNITSVDQKTSRHDLSICTVNIAVLEDKNMNSHRLTMYGFLFLGLIGLVFLGSMYFEAWSKYIEVATLIGAATGFVKLIYESNKTRKLKEAEFMSQLNRDYITNPHICKLFEKLEHDYRYKDKPSAIIKDEDVLSFVVYFTFFETLYDMIKKKIIKIESVDDLFGYRFFVFLHNQTIQDIELTNPIVMASYVNIFKLYDLWLKYRLKMVDKHGYRLNEFIYMWENNLYERHPHFLRFLKKDYNTFDIEVAKRSDLLNVYHMQNKGYKRMKKKGQQDLFEPSTWFEFYQMIRRKELFVKKANLNIQAYIGVVRLKKSHPFYAYVEQDRQSLLIDTVFVDQMYRGLNIQNELIAYVLKAYQNEVDDVLATIDPNNTKSVTNFKEEGFILYKQGLSLYGGKNRDLYIKRLSQ